MRNSDHRSSSASDKQRPAGQPLTIRAVLVGLLCVAFLTAATAYTDGFMAASELGGCHFPLGPVLGLLCVVLPLSWLTGVLRRRAQWSSGEKLYAMAMMAVTAGLPTFGLALYLFPVMTAPYYMASVENKWEEAFFGFIPRWMTPAADSTAVRWFYDGAPPGQAIPWGQWTVPLLAWSLLAAAMYLTMFCLGSIIRRQWIEKENLVFPLVELPLEMVLPQRHSISSVEFLRNRGVWIGFAIPFVIHNLQALRIYFPAIPVVNLQNIPLFASLTGIPWRQLSSRVYLHFSVIGFAYFLTAEVSLSLWLFWWFGRVQHVVADAIGRNPQLTRLDDNQYQGAFLAIVIYGVWVARGHLKDLWRQFWSGSSEGDTGRRPEAMSVRAEFGGLLAGSVLIVLWLTIAGMSTAYAVATLLIFLVICWGMSRLVVESGIMFAKATQMRPSLILEALVGAPAVPARSLTVLSFVEYVFMYDLKSFLMPQVMHAHKMADEAKMDRRHLYLAMAAAVVVSVLVAYWASLQVAYTKGALAMHPWFFISGPRANSERLRSLIMSPEPWDLSRTVAMLAGGAFTYLLIKMRQQFIWFPVHPIGYVVGNGFEASRMWFPFLIGWLAKSLVGRYGSVQLYRSLRAPFLGLVLGEYSAAGLWLLIDAIVGRVGHRIFP